MPSARKCGILLHISSLPGGFGIGDMGPAADRFVDFLSRAGVRAWQILPLTPTSGIFGHSPYSSPSAFAGNTLLISPELLCSEGLLNSHDIASVNLKSGNHVDFEQAVKIKRSLLDLAHARFRRDNEKFARMNDEFWDFCVEESHWLDDYAMFAVIKDAFGNVCWNEWPDEFRTRDWDVLRDFADNPGNAQLLDLCRFEQFLFFRQLRRLRELCRSRDVELIGDIPIYVGFDSADVWSRQDLFKLDDEGRPLTVAGVPPDYFSETGQRWGNPIYRWPRMQEEGFSWWVRRFRQALRGCDRVRVDHFRGFCGFWEIPSDEETAVNGAWSSAPGFDLFSTLRWHFSADGRLPFIAEDLGVITDDVHWLMDEFELPGMKILLFAFGEGMEQNPYVPHNHRRNCVVYTGTHDNNTALGWWRNEATPDDRERFSAYAGRHISEEKFPDAMRRMTLSSVADLAVISMQDVLEMGSSARMNTPSTAHGNWTWRLTEDDAGEACAAQMRRLAVLYGRFVEPAADAGDEKKDEKNADERGEEQG